LDAFFDSIVESPVGDKKHGTLFQRLVLEFFDVLFLHEFDRFIFGLKKDDKIDREKEFKAEMTSKYGAYRIGSWFNRLDGYYVKRDSFDAVNRCGFDFNGIIVECKNTRPTIDDLLQCFRYTLYFQNTCISKVPLTLLVCRRPPGGNSTIWDVNKRIFDRPMDRGETRLILILTMDELSKMKEYRTNDGDPALVLRNMIKSFQ
jgi:hypothetical protein